MVGGPGVAARPPAPHGTPVVPASVTAAPAAPAAPPVPAASVRSAAPASVAVPPAPPSPAAPPPAPASGAAAARPPINPFLANDPNAKAKRLARALVSDLVTYFPQKREEGLRDGTLKQLFREEIQKSFEEYLGQVGRELAESTPHFQDALNEILARGAKVF